MTLNEAAVALGVTAATLRQQVANGRLRAVKRGRDWHVTPGEVERYRRESLGKPGRHHASKSQRVAARP
jgi:excisionase family DNA binding protein